LQIFLSQGSHISKGFVQVGHMERGSKGRLTGEWADARTITSPWAPIPTIMRPSGIDAKACAAEFPDLRIIQEDR
jgi:hypothetical protein